MPKEIAAVEVNPELKRRLKIRCAIRGLSMKEVVDKLVTKWVEADERKDRAVSGQMGVAA